ncbi:MAG: TonB family protein [Sphingobacteriales bacterium]|nr:TonB family protein [Sphingobacteriales bacterium]
MSADNKHINYNANDIQRYLQGKMTPQEMHALERAALDDEFLMKKGGWKQWYRIAAALFILLGSAAIIYKYIFTNKPGEIQSVVAKQETKKEATQSADSIIQPNKSSSEIATTETKPPVTFKEKEATTKTFDSNVVAINKVPAKEKADDKALAKDEEVVVPKKAEEAKTVILDKETQVSANYKFSQDKKAKASTNLQGVVAAPATARIDTRFKTQNKNNQGLAENLNQNIFKGRVVNANNEPLPFTKISILNDSFKIGTYADAKGYFNFISLDTILPVEAKSIGYSNQTGVLKSGLLANNKLVLSENSQPEADIVIKSNRVDRVKSLRDLLKDTSKLAEPEDGWGNYATYMANNLELPNGIKINSQHGTVELSFTIDKNGVPQNINIDKSYGKQVDAEAIRLVKDGPKWKSKNRNKKGKVVVVF